MRAEKRITAMFKPSKILAKRAIDALKQTAKTRLLSRAVGSQTTLGFLSPSAQDERPVQLFPSSDELPKAGAPSPAQASAAIGERIESVLRVLSRERGMMKPGDRIVVLEKKPRFSADLLPRVLDVFGGREFEEALGDVLPALAAEFRSWVEKNTEDREKLGLRIEPDGRVTLECPAPPPPIEGLKPLPPLDR